MDHGADASFYESILDWADFMEDYRKTHYPDHPVPNADPDMIRRHPFSDDQF